ncbi:MAG: cyclase family protein [Candidatus Omnitrophota bacterium]
MALWDISLSLRSELPPWPGDIPFSRKFSQSISQGDKCNVSLLTMNSHFATHLDAPYHIVENGAAVDEIPLDVLIGPVLVHEVDCRDLILPPHLPSLDGVERLIFKTPNSSFIADSQFHCDYASMSLEAAKILTGAGVRLIGIDYFSIEAYNNSGFPVHHELCGKGVILVEGLDLRDVVPGWYELIVLPLKIAGADGGPCRAVLRSLD